MGILSGREGLVVKSDKGAAYWSESECAMDRFGFIEFEPLIFVPCQMSWWTYSVYTFIFSRNNYKNTNIKKILLYPRKKIENNKINKLKLAKLT